MKFTKILPYIVAVAIFALASIIYFHPLLKGQKLNQSDITQFTGMVKEINDFRADKNAEPYWTGASFSGMPAYQVSAYYPNDFVRVLDITLRFLPRPADYTFLYFLSFFVLMMALKVNWRLAIFGSLAFGFSTYLIIIFGAGHNAKAHAIAYMPLVLAGLLWVFQKRYILGFLVTGVAMALEIYTNHPQMTYYLGFSLLILGMVELINAIKEKIIPTFIKQVIVILAAVLLGVGANSSRLMAMKEYADHSTRGKSELTINPDGTKKAVTKGLDKAYITEYSYAKLETFNLFIPRFMGGGTMEKLGGDSNFYQLLEAKAGKKAAKEYSEQALTYWGDQNIVEAPAYIGAVIFFLFFLGMFLVKGRLKQWLVAATVFSILMSWGRNFDVLTNFFIDYFPLYNKFRAVSSIQIIAELSVPILGVLALKEFFSSKISSDEKRDALKKAVYVFGGLIIVGFLLAHGFSTFEGLRDAQYKQLPGLTDAIISDRKSMLLTDTLRSLFLMILSAGVLWMLLKEKLKQGVAILVLTLFILFDLISVDKKYVNETDFKSARKIDKPFIASTADKIILQDKSHYRVGNFTVNPMNDGSTSYFHQSIGGYHAAKLGRYQELFDFQIAKNNMQVLNMLNTKYFIIGNDKGEKQSQLNPDANGNAWFVEHVKIVNSANQEIQALDSLNTKTVAVYQSDPSVKDRIIFPKEIDSTASIKLLNYDVTTLTYQSKTNKEQFAVFSEIYYKDGWNAYVDGKLTPYVRVDYVLRGMTIPAGEHTIEFKFEPKVIQQGKIISLSSYALLLLITVGWFFYEKKRLKK
ncbi:YfhO family protein [Polaribacter sp. Z014]|uniref:YfhO family protein n=1 Tax=unclassified Polaribacter TaxID=196858 RepID=UPI00193B40F4|nr:MULTISPECIES: YfhO family protein [unclassified Polaribacter]MCL7763218.1 YfhO family protein [Polaribacter sp. Z014]QVY67157.1 YfhO family protein [Polaribacter sp. Q13]